LLQLARSARYRPYVAQLPFYALADPADSLGPANGYMAATVSAAALCCHFPVQQLVALPQSPAFPPHFALAAISSIAATTGPNKVSRSADDTCGVTSTNTAVEGRPYPRSRRATAAETYTLRDVSRPIIRDRLRWLIAKLYGVSDDEACRISASAAVVDDAREQLFTHYKIPFGDWEGLALALAREHVPAFRVPDFSTNR
jgi:hypothetical protein